MMSRQVETIKTAGASVDAPPPMHEVLASSSGASDTGYADETKNVRGFLTDKGYFLERGSAAEVYKKFEKNILNKELVNNHYQLYSYNVDWKQVRIKIKNPFING